MIYLDKNDCLLFQGDSITHGGRVFSNWDMNHVIGHGYQDYVAQTLGMDNYLRNPRIENRGVSGDRLPLIRARMQRDIIDIRPTIMSILDGVNDCWAYKEGAPDTTDPKGYDIQYRALLDDILKELPDLKLIICQPFAYREDFVEDVRERAEYARQIAKDYGAVFVPFWDALDKYVKNVPDYRQIVWDGVHPTYTGHGIMAKCWLETVEKAYNK